MWLQLVLMIIAGVVCFSHLSEDNGIVRHRYVTFLIVLLVLQSALRHLSVGADTTSYLVEWEQFEQQSWGDVFRKFVAVYFHGQGKDGGYGILMKTIQLICPTFRLYLFLFAIVFFTTLFRLIERYLETLPQIFLAFCLYQVMFYSFFSVTGMRQGMATIFTFFCVKLIEDKRLTLFTVLIILASFIHKSVLLFYPLYFLAGFKRSNFLLIGSMISLPILFPFARDIATFLVDFSGTEQYRWYVESEADVTAPMFLIFILFEAITVFLSKRKNDDNLPNLVVNAMAMAVFFTPMMWVDSSLMRVIQYYSIFALIAVPLSIKDFNNSKTLYWVYMAIILAMTLRHNYEYHFLWENIPLSLYN